MLETGETGKPEGCIVAFTYPNGTGWVGFFIVSASLRQKGYGRVLWKGLEDSFAASKTKIIGLDGVQEQVKTYERRGFVDCARIPLMTRPGLKEKPFDQEKALGAPEGTRISDFKSVDPQRLAKLDVQHTGLDRSALWTKEAIFDRKDAYGFALLSTDPELPELLGYILVRRCEQGHRFGPLYAETYDQAKVLLSKAMEHVAEEKGSFIAEIFGSNPAGQRLFEELGWTWCGIDYHRMWLGGRVPKEQQDGGLGTKGMFAIFDAAEG
jgi:GNAT superfamily N-acetyltransferase